MQFPIVIICSILIICTITFAFLIFFSESEYYVKRTKTNLSKSNLKFIKTLDPATDEIELTLAKVRGYSTYVYVKLKDTYIDLSCDKFKTYSHPEPVSLDSVKEIINYLYSVTGNKFVIVDKTEENFALLESINTIEKSSVTRIESRKKSEEEYF